MLAWITPWMLAPMSSTSPASTLEQQYMPNSALCDTRMQQFLLNDSYTTGLNGSLNSCTEETSIFSINNQNNRVTNPLSQSLLSDIATKMQHITIPASLSSNLQSLSEQLSETSSQSTSFHQASGLSLPLLKDWAAYENGVGNGGPYTQFLTIPASFTTIDTFSTMPQETHALGELCEGLVGGNSSRIVSNAASSPIFVSDLEQCRQERVIQHRLLSGTSWNAVSPAVAGIVREQSTYNNSVECISQNPFEAGFADRAGRFPSLTSENFTSLSASLGASGKLKAAALSDRGKLACGCEDMTDHRLFSSKGCKPEHELPQSRADVFVEDISKSITPVFVKKRHSTSHEIMSSGKRPKGEGQTMGDAGQRQKCPNSCNVKESKGKSNCSGEIDPSAEGKEGSSKATDAPKQGYIHVRARRGQATDSHSLAERVRREKISERMRLLQDLVPGCSKITSKAMMLDEIINYVQSLQQQVEFLSMKLAALNPRIDFNFDNIFMGEVIPPIGSPQEVNGSVSEMGPCTTLSYQLLQSSLGDVRDSAPEDFCSTPILSETSLIDINATSTAKLPATSFS